MTVRLDHTIVQAHNKEESATFFAAVLGLAAPVPTAPYRGSRDRPQHQLRLLRRSRRHHAAALCIPGRRRGVRRDLRADHRTLAPVLGRSPPQSARRDPSARVESRLLLRGSQRSFPRSAHPPEFRAGRWRPHEGVQPRCKRSRRTSIATQTSTRASSVRRSCSASRTIRPIRACTSWISVAAPRLNVVEVTADDNHRRSAKIGWPRRDRSLRHRSRIVGRAREGEGTADRRGRRHRRDPTPRRRVVALLPRLSTAWNSKCARTPTRDARDRASGVRSGRGPRRRSIARTEPRT